MKTFTIQRPYGELTIREQELNDLLDNLKFINSILLMYLEGSDTFENEWEVSFPKEDAKEVLKEYFFKNTNYSREYLSKVFDQKSCLVSE